MHPLTPTGHLRLWAVPWEHDPAQLIRGAGRMEYDVAVSKRFAVTERFGLEFRAEGFDVFNHHNFYADETNLSYLARLQARSPPR